MKKYVTILFLLVSIPFVFGQGGHREITYGIFAGGIYSSMSNLQGVLIPENYYTGYSLTEKGQTDIMAGVFINWKYPYARVALQTELSYSSQSTNLNYTDIKDLKYKINFGFDYINFGTQLKYYPIGGFYIGAGPYLGLNIRNDNIKYTSNGQELSQSAGIYFEPDSTIEKTLKESLSGKHYFYAGLSMGYEFRSMRLALSYNLGLNDALLTEENGHRFRENNNKISSFSLSFGYFFDFDDLANF